MTPPPKAAPSLRSLRAAGYVRVSTTDQPLDGQEAELVAYCRARGWELELLRDVGMNRGRRRPPREAVAGQAEPELDNF
jgi:hypothetical protein